MNNYSVSVKNEILSKKLEKDERRLAFLSAVIHTAGSVYISNEGFRLSISCEDKLKEKLQAILTRFYGEYALDEGKKLVLLGEYAQEVLFDCRIFGVIDGETTVVSGIADVLIPDKECRQAYVKGAFLGAGSVSLRTGYHLEFALSNADMATDLASLLSEEGIESKITTHNEKYVVYVGDSESVSDCLALMGANQAVMALTLEVVRRDVNKRSNRVKNCDFANIEKTVSTSVRQCEDVRLIERKIGISSLAPKLRKMAQARLDNPEATYAALATLLGEPKSTVKNRLNKLSAIAASLREESENKKKN